MCMLVILMQTRLQLEKTVEVSELPKKVNVEISMIAVIEMKNEA